MRPLLACESHCVVGLRPDMSGGREGGHVCHYGPTWRTPRVVDTTGPGGAGALMRLYPRDLLDPAIATISANVRIIGQAREFRGAVTEGAIWQLYPLPTMISSLR